MLFLLGEERKEVCFVFVLFVGCVVGTTNTKRNRFTTDSGMYSRSCTLSDSLLAGQIASSLLLSWPACLTYLRHSWTLATSAAGPGCWPCATCRRGTGRCSSSCPAAAFGARAPNRKAKYNTCTERGGGAPRGTKQPHRNKLFALSAKVQTGSLDPFSPTGPTLQVTNHPAPPATNDLHPVQPP